MPRNDPINLFEMSATFAAVLRVVTISDRALRGDYADTAGPRAAEILIETFPDATVAVDVVSDGIDSVVTAVNNARRAGARVVITVGGTGIAPRDLTPEASATLITQELPGISEAIRREGQKSLNRAIVSRGLAGVVGAEPHQGYDLPMILINLAGSENAAEVGCRLVAPLLPHLVKQMDGSGHDAS